MYYVLSNVFCGCFFGYVIRLGYLFWSDNGVGKDFKSGVEFMVY